MKKTHKMQFFLANTIFSNIGKLCKNISSTFHITHENNTSVQIKLEKGKIFPDSRYLKAYQRLKRFGLERVSKLTLPRIAVIGAQSSGKSSVLEKIIGVDILPKGSELTTRCPIIIHLNSTNGSEYGTIQNGTYIEITKIKDRIIAAISDQMVGNYSISAKPITIELFLRNSLELTLIDLPGFTKIPVKDQPDNIENIVEDVVCRYISDPNTIILAISPANADLANSDALKLAKRVDPNGKRTLGIISKVDMMDKDTNCTHILKNCVFPLNYGYIGVVNRSVLELKNKITVEKSLKNEAAFFSNHKSYQKIFPKIGTLFLRKRLQKVFNEYLKSNLYTLRETIVSNLTAVEKETFFEKMNRPSPHFLIREYHDVLQALFLDKKFISNVFEINDKSKRKFADSITQINLNCNQAERSSTYSSTKFSYDKKLLMSKLKSRDTSLFNQKNNIDELIISNLENSEKNILHIVSDLNIQFKMKINSITTKKVGEFLKMINHILCTDSDLFFQKMTQKIKDMIGVEKNCIIFGDKNVDIMEILLKVLLKTSHEQPQPIFDIARMFSSTPQIRQDSFLKCKYYEREIIHDVIVKSAEKYYLAALDMIINTAMNTIQSGIKDFLLEKSDTLYREKILYKKSVCKYDDVDKAKLIEIKKTRKLLKRSLKILHKYLPE